MVEYRVSFTPAADAELLESYQWGVQFWGEDEARIWLRKFYVAIYSRLTTFPLGCALAPENEELDMEVRQLILGRYRILFSVDADVVRILYIRGPYHGESA
jgi:plasmid stabilization system protein ParE